MIIASSLPQSYNVSKHPHSKQASETAEESQFSATKKPAWDDYQFDNISPREIDELANALREEGKVDLKLIMTLSSYGEEFQSHLHSLPIPGSHSNLPKINPSQKFDLVTAVEDDIKASRQNGSPSDIYERLIEKISDGRPHRATAPTSSLHAAVFQAHMLGRSQS